MRGRMEGNEVEGREYEVVKPLVSPSRTWGLHRESLEGFEQGPDMINWHVRKLIFLLCGGCRGRRLEK